MRDEVVRTHSVRKSQERSLHGPRRGFHCWREEMSDLWWEAPKGIVSHVFADRLTNEILLRPSGFTCQGT